MKHFIWAKILILSLMGSGLFAQTISINEYLDLVKRKHNLETLQDLAVKIEKLNQKKMEGIRDWHVTSSTLLGYEKTASFDPFSGKAITSAGLEGKLEKTYWSNGGRLSLNWRYNILNQDLPASAKAFNIPENHFQNVFSLNFQMPLWQNYGGLLTRLGHDLKAFDIDIAGIRRRELQENFLSSAAAEFLEWVLIDEQLKVARKELEINTQQKTQVERRFAAHLVEKTDLIGSEKAFMMAQQTVLFLEGRWQVQQTYLAEFIEDSLLNNKTPVYNIFAFEPELNHMQVKTKILQKSRVLAELNLQKEQLKLGLKGFRENLKPQLFLNLGAGIQKSASVFSKSMLPNKPNFSAGVVFQMPLGQTTVKAEVEESAAQIRQLEYSIQTTQLDLQAQASQTLARLNSLKKIMALNEKQIQKAAEKTVEEMQVYKQGRSTLNFVLISRTEEQNARLSFIENVVNYHILSWQLKAQLDELLPEGE